ncbi:YetF domain-containing protein [Mucilaginibacter ginkgonis]|uniref:DUF421 domain-containing protein n=1 Tax=Mucilaginibacter ginkgonis TaxID=2682091 RepID=A0A6I4HY86_9SPHI|nr:YetF domain-containing protein [Mucilaginibacter ginkgonis]QQL49426.1 DUF421 domain-containing protein [Mucilaginibacter ginkgonis]
MTLIEIFGDGEHLNMLQMSSRGIVTFFIALILFRVSGRRSSGLKTPLDNIIMVLLGAVLSRGVVGASPYVPVVMTCLAIVLMHRFFAWCVAKYPKLGSVLEGDKILVYYQDRFIRENMINKEFSKEDVMQGVRKAALTEDLEQIDKIYIEKNGEISTVKKM